MKNKYLLLVLVLAVVFSFAAFNFLPVFAQEGGGGTAEDKCAGKVCVIKQKCQDNFEASCTAVCDPATGVCGTCAPDCAGHDAPADKCAGVPCSERTLTCPDNFVAKCMPTCDPATGVCRTCDPDCSGHQGAPPTEEKPSEKICSPGQLKCDNIDLKRCSVDGMRWEFVESCKYGCDQGKLACNPASKEEGVRCGSIVCPIGHVCANPGRNLCCPSDMPMECNGRCVRSMDECGPKPPSYCGNRYCEGEEDEYNCPQDCPRKAETQPQPEPPSYNIPQGCREEIDERGNRRVVCERRTEEMCPSQEKVERMKKDCMNTMIEGKRGNPIMGNDERGCSAMMRCDLSGGGTGSWLGEKKCPSQEERDKFAKECSSRGARAVMREDFNGCLIVDCVGDMRERPLEFKMCSPEDERAWKDCKQRGGKPQSDPSADRSCEKYTHCEMPGRGFCPVDQEVIDKRMQEAKSSCMEKGGNPVQMVDHMNCNYIYCAEHGEDVEKMCPSPEEKRKAKEECKMRGEWYHAPGFDERGCEIVECFQSGPSGARPPEFECKRDVPQEAFSNCEMRGGEFVVRNDDKGCIVYANCIMRGDERRIEYTEIREIPSVATLLNTALKLESLKIEFDKLGKKIEEIAIYYEGAGNEEDAKIFRTALGMIEGVKNKVDEIKGKIRARAKSATMDDITEIIHDIQYLKEVALPDIIYVMMGGDISETGAIPTEAATEAGVEVPEGVKNCGSDGFCFMLSLRTCQKVRVTPEGEGMGKPVLTIEGMEGNNCKMIVKVKSQMAEASMTCLYPNYATGMKGPEDLLPYCEGDLVEMMKMGPPQGGGRGGPSEQAEMMGCEKVERGINQKGVCGNGCCEDQFGENPQRCPMDCMGGSQGQRGSCWCENNGRCEYFECQGNGGCIDCGGTASCICEDDGMCSSGECPACKDCGNMGGPGGPGMGGGGMGPQGPMGPGVGPGMGGQGQMPREEYREPMPREEYVTPGPGGQGGYVSESNPQPSPGPSAGGGGGGYVSESNPQPSPSPGMGGTGGGYVGESNPQPSP